MTITEVDTDPEKGVGFRSPLPALWEPLPAMSMSVKSKPTNKSRDLTNHNPYGMSVTLDMSDFVQDAINHYVTVTKTDREPKLAQTPFCPPGSLLASDWEVVGELEKGCHSVVMKNMWVARTARPDLYKPCHDLAGICINGRATMINTSRVLLAICGGRRILPSRACWRPIVGL